MVDKLIVPRRKIKKNWYVGLHQDPADRSQPDVHDELVSNTTHAHRKSNLHLNKLYILFWLLSSLSLSLILKGFLLEKHESTEKFQEAV